MTQARGFADLEQRATRRAAPPRPRRRQRAPAGRDVRFRTATPQVEMASPVRRAAAGRALAGLEQRAAALKCALPPCRTAVAAAAPSCRRAVREVCPSLPESARRREWRTDRRGARARALAAACPPSDRARSARLRGHARRRGAVRAGGGSCKLDTRSRVQGPKKSARRAAAPSGPRARFVLARRYRERRGVTMLPIRVLAHVCCFLITGGHGADGRKILLGSALGPSTPRRAARLRSTAQPRSP